VLVDLQIGGRPGFEEGIRNLTDDAQIVIGQIHCRVYEPGDPRPFCRGTNSSLRTRAMPRPPRQTDPPPKSGPDRRGSFTRQARLNHKSEDEALRCCSPHQTIVCDCC
jgi:hypothetical protein